MENRNLVLTLESNAFAKMKEDFDNILKRTLGNMQVKESHDATLTLKLNISLEETDVPDFESPFENAMKTIHKPRFDHKVTSVMQIKNEESGSLKGDYELVWSEEMNDYVMKPIDNGQRSFFDDEIYADAEAVHEEDEVCERSSLPAHNEDDEELPMPFPSVEDFGETDSFLDDDLAYDDSVIYGGD